MELTSTIQMANGIDYIRAQGETYEDAKAALEAEGTKLIAIRTDN